MPYLPLPTHARFLAWVPGLALGLLVLPDAPQAQPAGFDGPWEMHVACSSHVTNKRPPFEWTAAVSVQGGQFSHRRGATETDPAKAYDETWNGRFSGAPGKGQLSLGAKGSRRGGDPWELRFAPASVQQGQAELPGAVHALEGGKDLKVRTCTAHLRRAGPATGAAAGTTAAAAAPSASATLAAAPTAAAPIAAAPTVASPVAAAPIAAAPAAAPPPPPTAVVAPVPPAARTGPRSAAELRRALYEDAGFDLALVAALPGSGNLKRTLDGKWTTGRGAVRVGKRGVVASDVHYNLKGFAQLAPTERGTTLYAGSFYQASLYHPNPVPGSEQRSGFSGPAPRVAAGIPAGPAPRPAAQQAEGLSPAKAFDAALAQAVDQALTAAVGKPVSFALDFESHGDVVLVPRHLVDPAYNPPRVQGQWIVRIERGEAEVLGYITQAQIRQGLQAHTSALQAADQRDANLLALLKNSAASGPDSLIGSISVRTGVNVKPCTLKAELEIAPYLLKHEPIGAWLTDRAPKWSHEPVQGFESAEALFEELKSGRRCTAVFGRGPMIAQLAVALDRDRLGNIVYPQPQPQKAVLALKAKALGFEDLAALEFAESIGSRDPRQVKALKDLGISSAAGVAQARERLKKCDARVAENLDALLALLQDEAEARKQGTSIERLQAARAEREAREARVAAAAQREGDQRLAKEFPYVMTLRCRIGNQHIGIEPCLHSDGVGTELELRNGADYRMYKVHDVQTLGSRAQEGTEVNLRAKFVLRVQNASNAAVLDVVIRDRASGAVKYQQSAGHFKVVAVQN
ncbi:MAG: hypothetical protein JNN03_19495 [Rubrivivax sp.]|nr:hypothetical protein [Rubrivivax sp.]